MPDIQDDLRDTINTLTSRGDYGELQQLCTATIDTVRANDDPESEAVALLGLVTVHTHRGKFAEAQSYVEQASAIAERIQNVRLTVGVLEARGHLLTFGEFRHHASLRLFQEALDTMRAAGEVDDEVSLLVNIGNAHIMLQQVMEAQVAYQSALTIARATNNQHEIVWATNGLALVDVLKSKDYTKALTVFERAIAVTQGYGYRVDECALWMNQGHIHMLNLHHYHKAVDDFRQALTIAEAIGHFNLRVMTLYSLADVEMKSGNEARAQDLFEQALTLTRDYQARTHETQVLGRIAQSYSVARQYEQAESFGRQALALAQSLENDELQMIMHITLGNIYFRTWHFNLARDHYRPARDILRQVGSNASVNQVTSAIRLVTVIDLPFALLRLVGIRRD